MPERQIEDGQVIIRPSVSPYVVKEALLPKEEGAYCQRWYVYRDNLPVDAINQYIHRKSGRSSGSGKTYAYALAEWLNFLQFRDTEYYYATLPDVEAFKDHLAYGLHCNSRILKITSNITYETLRGAIMAIQGFYRWFAGHVEVFAPVVANVQGKFKARRKVKHSFLYGQIYEAHVDEIIDIENMRLKPSGYKKHWLTEAEKKAFLANFRTERDKAIFMLLCEGMRIDEALSIKYSAYDSGELTVKPSRSKGYTDEYEDKFRIIAFHDQRTSEYIDRYIQTERVDVETSLDDYLVPMFVNLKKHDDSYGKAVAYRNWWGILKTAAKNVGIDPTEIATHVGRRTFVQEKLEEGEDPEIIRQMVGWASLKPLDAYRDTRSKVVIKNAAERRRNRWKDGINDGQDR